MNYQQNNLSSSNFNGQENDEISNNQSTKNNNIFRIVIILIIIGMICGGIIFANKSKKEAINNGSNNDLSSENKEEVNKPNDNIDSVDEWESDAYDENVDFLFNIDGVFTVTGRGTIVSGIIQKGSVKVGDTIQIVGMDKEVITAEVKYLQMSGSLIDEAFMGDNVGIWLKDITSGQVEKGQALIKK